MRRVAVTGIGVIAPGGNNGPDFWGEVSAGRSAIGELTSVPIEELFIKIGAEVKGFDPKAHFQSGQLALLDRVAQFAVVAAREAVADARLAFDRELALRTAAIVGTGVAGLHTLDDNFYRVYAKKAKRLHPFTIPKLMINAAVSHITMDLGLTGPAFSVSSACASATHAIGQAFHMVRSGQVEIAVTGGTEACITFGTMKGWEALRVMSSDTCRPFSKDRTGMVLGEGAGIFVLEPMERAQARGATIYGELSGFGMSSDAGDIVQPSAEGAARAMTAALADGGLRPEEIGYVNAHGTGTTANDTTETRALKCAFGGHATKLAVSSTKSMHGHAMGAAGALELAATLYALRDGLIPPTVNYTEADPNCDLDYVPNVARPQQLEVAICNSFAFGGLNAVLAVKRVDS